jgi:hypothetical protein
VVEECVSENFWEDKCTWGGLKGMRCGRAPTGYKEHLGSEFEVGIEPLSPSLRGRLNCIEHGPCGQRSRHSPRRCETWRSGQKLRTYEEFYLRILIEVAAMRLGPKLFARTRCDSRGSVRYVVVVRTRIVYLLPSNYPGLSKVFSASLISMSFSPSIAGAP